jgi:acetyl esterase/lipase
MFGALNALGRRLARNGVGAAMINYRLSPIVKHPAHIQDVARAFAWLHKNIGQYGGRADQMFVCGHSAGGHLAALLGTDERYLKAEGLSLKDIKGVIPISGVYVITDLPLKVGFNAALPGGAGTIGGSFALRFNPATVVFGGDPKVMKDASPLTHVNPRCPPFLILYAEFDFPTCDRMSEKLCQALKDQKCDAEIRMIKLREHVTIVALSGMDGDPTGQAILDFIAAHTR